MSNKLAKVASKWHKSKKIAKATKKAAEKEADVGKTAHKAIQFIGGVGIGTLTKATGRLPFIKVGADQVATGLGLGLSLILKGAKKKFAEDLMWAGANAWGGRAVWTGQIFVMSDGKTIKVDQGVPSEKEDSGIRAKVKVDERGRPQEVEVETKAA